MENQYHQNLIISMKSKKRIGILTGGGDVQPLNAVIASAIEEANRKNYELIGFQNGWRGILNNNFVKLNHKKIDGEVGGTILKSSRVNLAKVNDGVNKTLSNIAEIGLEGLIVIGGEDTLSNSLYLKDIPQSLISKTIDNDVGIINGKEIINYFTLGHPTAAEKISSFVSLQEGLRTTAYSHERIIIVESMGMHAGWLALSSSLGNPDFIIIPEFQINYEHLVDSIKDKYLSSKNVIVVIAEGARWEDGKYISADYSEVDDFGHPRFKGSANILCEMLKRDLKKYFDTRNVNSVNPSYLYRSGKPNSLDFRAAVKLGNYAVKLLSKNTSSQFLLTTNFVNEKLIFGSYDVSTMNNFENLHRFVTEVFYDPVKMNITKSGKKYLKKMVREFTKSSYKI